jgi:predicted CXXCH cytochrome family protein
MSAIALLLVAVALQAPDVAPATRAAQNELCLACHGDRDLSLDLPSGETRSLFIDLATFTASVHGDKLSCVDCHTDMTEVPHPARPLKTRRDFSLAYNEQCKRCHFANFTRSMDGVHAAAIARGDTTAPLCVDCHGAHDITPATRPRSRISRTCGRCHDGVARVYAKSVHGRALIDEDNPDVPTCADCHRAHDVGGPRQDDWRLRTPELCARCHSDEQIMARYGLSINVLTTYVADFHGMTASLRTSRASQGRPIVARCTDCHGVHDILKVDEPGSRVLKANLVQTCRQCHADATENFPDAWLSHYEPSWDRAPLVYAVTLMYRFLIPFMIGGLVLQVLLHLWRVVVNR